MARCKYRPCEARLVYSFERVSPSSGDLDQERKSVKKIEEMFDEQGKIEGLIVNLIGDSKLVLIHSSVSSMGFVQSGAESVVEALKSLSKEGLLL